MNKKEILGHIMAIVSIIIWGTTFVSTKQLLEVFSPEEILVYRFFLATALLLVIPPVKISYAGFRQEVIFALLGVTGISLYYWVENIALKYTYASNVGFICSAIPLFTALAAHFILKDEKFSIDFILGFIVAVIGIFMIIYNGRIMKLNPIGDLLAILTTVFFALYSVLLKKLKKEYTQLFIVKKIFLYGFIFILPIGLITGISIPEVSKLTTNAVGNFLFLSLVASVACFMLWNKSISIIGSVSSSNYIYFVPVITMVSSYIVLNEKVTFIMLAGGVLIFTGVALNNIRFLENSRRKRQLKKSFQ